MAPPNQPQIPAWADWVIGKLSPLVSNPFRGYLPPEAYGKQKSFYAYTLNFDSSNKVAASVTTNGQFTTQNDSTFICFAINATPTTTVDAALAKPRPFLVTIQDSGTGQSLMPQTGVHFDNLFGDANQPFYLPFPYPIGPSATISVAMQNLSATDYYVRFAFLGFKVF